MATNKYIYKHDACNPQPNTKWKSYVIQFHTTWKPFTFDKIQCQQWLLGLCLYCGELGNVAQKSPNKKTYKVWNIINDGIEVENKFVKSQ